MGKVIANKYEDMSSDRSTHKHIAWSAGTCLQWQQRGSEKGAADIFAE